MLRGDWKSLRLYSDPNVKFPVLSDIKAVFSCTRIASLPLGCWYIWRLMECIVRKRGGGGERKEIWGERGNSGSGFLFFLIQILLLDFFLCLLSCFLQPPYWHRQIGTACRAEWQEDGMIMCVLNISDQPLPCHSQHEEALLHTTSFNHFRQAFSSCLSIKKKEDLPPILSWHDRQVNY